jgi:GrpB-like predicted nucleotidyltransferase (UPF0157 family)
MDIVWPGFVVTDGSDRSDPIMIVAYDGKWQHRFQVWRDRIRDSVGDAALRIEHIGSTSVAGLAAKPIIDIQVSVNAMADERVYVDQLEELGVQLRSRDEFHRYFRPFPDQPRDAHVHVCDLGSTWEREHLLFRDYLRSHPGARGSYAAVKREVAERWVDDGWAYTDAKGEIILDILEDAAQWAASVDWQLPPQMTHG